MLFNDKTFKEQLEIWKSKLTTNCPICKGEGLIYNETKTEVIDLCDCVKKARSRAKLDCDNFPIKYLTTEANLNLISEENREEIKNYSDNIDEILFESTNILIHSTELKKIAALQHYFINCMIDKINPSTKKPYTIFMGEFEEIIECKISKGGYENKNRLDKIISEYDILIINNIGQESQPKGQEGSATKTLNYILSKRLMYSKSCILSSNFAIEQFSTIYNKNISSCLVDAIILNI